MAQSSRYSMTKRWSAAVSVIALLAALTLIPASMRLARDSWRVRTSVESLKLTGLEDAAIRDTRILNGESYELFKEVSASADSSLQLIAVVMGQEQYDNVVWLWDSIQTSPRVSGAGMTARAVTVGGEIIEPRVWSSVSVSGIENVEAFAIRTGIRVVPFTLVIAGASIVAAGPGLPDADLVIDAVERVQRSGPKTSTRFRTVTPEINSALTALESLSSTAADQQ